MLKDNNNQTLWDTNDILNEEVMFYEELYTSKISSNKANVDLMYNNFFTGLEPEVCIDIDDLDVDFQVTEVLKKIDSFNPHKSPGSDGLPI